MSTMKFTLGMACAGVLAFGLVLTAYGLTKPVFGPASSSTMGTEVSHSDEEHAIDDANEEGDALAIDMAILGRWETAPATDGSASGASSSAFLTFADDDTFTGSDGCNQVAGGWEVDTSGSFEFTQVAMTRMFCDDVAIPQSAWSANHAEVTSNDELILTGADGTEFSLVRSTLFELDGSWATTSGDISISRVTFTGDGQWNGTVGCSVFDGAWQLAQNDISIAEGKAGQGEATATLSIGPEPADSKPACSGEGAYDTFVLAYDTQYLLTPNGDGAFTLQEDTGVTDKLAPVLEFLPTLTLVAE